MPGARFEHYRQTSSTHAGIHHGDEHRVGRPELFSLVESIGADENARILMAQIRDQQLLGHAVSDALHRRYRTILSAEIGEQHQRRARYAASRPNQQAY